MLKKKLKRSPIEAEETVRASIISDPNRFFEELPERYNQMERRGRKELWRSLGEAAVLVRVAQEHEEILNRIPTEDQTESETRRYQTDALVKDVVYLLMKPEGKDEITKASKYITVIRFLLSAQVPEQEFVSTLRKMGGIENICKKARRKGICDIKQGLGIVDSSEIAETEQDHYPKLDKEFLEKLIHVDMGSNMARLFGGKQVLVRLKISNTPGWKNITGKIVDIEE